MAQCSSCAGPVHRGGDCLAECFLCAVEYCKGCRPPPAHGCGAVPDSPGTTSEPASSGSSSASSGSGEEEAEAACAPLPAAPGTMPVERPFPPVGLWRSLKGGTVHLGDPARASGVSCQARIAAAQAAALTAWPPGPTYYCRNPKCFGEDGGCRIYVEHLDLDQAP